MVWKKPWTMTEGFLIGGGLIIAGLMLEWSVGSVVWDYFAWPANFLVLIFFLLMIIGMHVFDKRVYAFRFLGTYQAAVPALVYTVILTIVMGLTRQTINGMWINNMLTFWPFVLIYLYFTVILGVVILRRLRQMIKSPGAWGKDITFLLNHLGLFIAITTATLGSADMQRVKMIVAYDEPEWRALDNQGAIREMPIAIELKKFIMETYDDGTPKRFASTIEVYTQKEQNFLTTIDVNKPVTIEGWKIYQYGYDTQMGAMSNTSILELISDPWLPAVYVGIYMMLAGAVLMIIRSIPWRNGVRKARKHPKTTLLLCALITACFFCVHHFMPILHSDTLVPALQSPWFRPHIVVYMLAYTLMGAIAAISLWLICSKKAAAKFNNLYAIVAIGLSLITIGMLFGALWAKEAWGHYWSWDPKETWAAITWFSYLTYIHYRHHSNHRERLSLWLLIVCFALLQMCWWGINYLPSAQQTSVHTYSM